MSKNGSRPEDRIWLDLLSPQLTKSQRTRRSIVEAAIEIYATVGFSEATFERVAGAAGISRPLVLHYFPEREELLLTSLRFIRAVFQRLAVEAIRGEKEPARQLSAYVEATFDWTRTHRKHAVVWLLMYYKCTLNEEIMALNTELVSMGYQRIATMIKQGIRSGEFSRGNASVRAKLIQTLITGALVSSGTEKLPFSEKAYRNHVIRACLALAQGER